MFEVGSILKWHSDDAPLRYVVLDRRKNEVKLQVIDKGMYRYDVKKAPFWWDGNQNHLLLITDPPAKLRERAVKAQINHRLDLSCTFC